MQYFKCYSARLANYLVHKGFVMLGTEANLKKPKFDVFLFIESPQLREAVEAYSKEPFKTIF